MYNKLYGLDYFVFRLSNPYGERQNPNAAQGAIPVFLNKIFKDETIDIWGDGSITRDYIYISDVAELLGASLKIHSAEKVFNIGSGKGESLNGLLDVMKKITGKKIQVNYNKGRDFDVQVNILDVSLVQSIFKWNPVIDLENGIRRTYQYLKDNSN